MVSADGAARNEDLFRDVNDRIQRLAADMLVESGPTQGQTCRAIYRLDGDRLRYCGTYSATRATEFKAVAGYYLVEFDRGEK